AKKVKGQTADQGSSIRFRGRRESLGFVSGGDETIDRVARPGSILDCRQSWAYRLDVSPMLLKPRSLFNPAANGLDLLMIQGRLLRLGGRHALVGIVTGDPVHQATAGGVARLIGSLNRQFAHVQAQPSLAPTLVRAMAGVAAVGQKRLNLA